MARIRTIKPEFWSHPVTGRLDDACKCLAIALLNLADDHGYFYADPATVRSFCRPFDDDSTITRRCLAQLVVTGYLEIREHATRGQVGLVVGFDEHQRVDRARDSSIKTYFDSSDSTNVRRGLDDQSTLEGKGKEGKGNTPLPPKGGRRSRRNRIEILSPYGETVTGLINSLLPDWPHVQPKDNSPIRIDIAMTAERVDKILREQPEVTPALLEQCGRIYLAEKKNYYRAPQFFFGVSAGETSPPWTAYARMVIHREQQKAVTA